MGNPGSHLLGLMRPRPASLVADTTWKVGYAVWIGGASYVVPLDVTATVRGDTLHVIARGQDSFNLTTKAADSTIVESADYTNGILQKASGKEETVERWGSTQGNTQTLDVTWPLEAQ
jgi:hypothetical protein